MVAPEHDGYCEYELARQMPWNGPLAARRAMTARASAAVTRTRVRRGSHAHSWGRACGSSGAAACGAGGGRAGDGGAAGRGGRLCWRCSL